ncbi:hypothetical protein BGZ96_002567 [Linnemannia gamsii]|uniref:F-box domain-containing protein n=1 Tax=Linnemannia gamsii TaxID=64522 RepID=A0ABQ7KAS4_9FUNG|nr:hypothetical protein BGZ96_002567 [Linnemannia gamsii]
MTPASACFFQIPELAAYVTALLNPNDILHLMQTSHRMHATMEPWFYHHLKTIYASDKTNLCESLEGQKALARNIHYIRTWSTDLMNLIFFLHATTATTATTSAPPLLTAGESSPPPVLVPLPPMTNVTKLALSLCRDTPLKKASENRHFESNWDGQSLAPDIHPIVPCQHFPSNFIQPTRTIDRLCGTLRCFPKLRKLDLHYFCINDSRSARNLSSALQEMSSLTHLEVYFDTMGGHSGAVLMVLFSCPPSVRSVTIEKVEYKPYKHSYSWPVDYYEMGCVTDEIVAHGLARTPLINLRDLRIKESSGWVKDEDFHSMFRLCPSVVNVDWKFHSIPHDVDGPAIARMCPKICNITFQSIFVSRDPNSWPYELAETLPENQLETLNHRERDHRCDVALLNTELVGRAMRRHTLTLREIRIDHKVPNSSREIAFVLESCASLEVLSVIQSTLDLGDSVASPWASSSLTLLELDIDTRLGSKPYYFRPPPSRRSGKEKRIFGQLEILYRQIGKQKNLRVLQLGKGYQGRGDRKIPEDVQPYPGMLRLSDRNGIVPGYLDMLAELSKLEKIGGDIGPETKDRKLAANAAEVDWILEHWPRLYWVKFLPLSRWPENLKPRTHLFPMSM